MKLTRVTAENAEFFAHLCPEYILSDDSFIKLGVFSDEDEAVSICAVGIYESMAYVKWIYTDENMREQGSGTFLMNELIKLMDGISLTGISVNYSSDDKELDTFLMENDFLTGENNCTYRIPITDILYGAMAESMLAEKKISKNVHRLTDLGALKAVIEYLTQNDISPLILDGISREYSFVYIDEEGVKSGIFISEPDEENLHVNYIFNDGLPRNMVEIFILFYETVTKEERTDGFISFTDVSESGITIAEILTGADRDIYRESGQMFALKLL